jgi:hypothetical protein
LALTALDNLVRTGQLKAEPRNEIEARECSGRGADRRCFEAPAFADVMNEAETRAEHIDPAIKAAGWGVIEGSRVHREYLIPPGRMEAYGRRGWPLCADHIVLAHVAYALPPLTREERVRHGV